MENMSIYADKKPKVSSKNNEKKPSSSIYYDLPDINYRRSFETQNAENSNDNSYSKPPDDRMKYLMKKYREIIHYNSPEPRKYGARAFTKNSEIYIAPGEENVLPHELGHVYQQETQNIPATGEMKGEKVNTDPKLEKEAEENYKNINNHIPKVFISDKRKSSTNSVMQFAQPNGAVAKCCIPEYDIKNLFEKIPGNGKCISLSEAKYYCEPSNKRLLSYKQYKKIQKCINELKEYCDDEGIKSVLEGANENVIPSYAMLQFYKNDFKKSKGSKFFVHRLELMTDYIKSVSEEEDTDGEKIGEKYWIRSTGSDPHYKGQHALFLVNRKNQEGYEDDDSKKEGKIAKVYKPHDLRADAAVIGEQGIFHYINEKLKDEKILDDTIIKGENALATMSINVAHHTEKFVTKKSKMTKEEAQKYFFRMGILKAVTDVLAIIDLHCDNIMPTKNGPMIIDAEINFFHYGENSSLEGGSASPLTCSNVNGRSPNSLFNVGESEQDNVTSTEVFNANQSDYKAKYEDGYRLMKDVLQKKQNEFANIFVSQLEGENFNGGTKIRILPLATQEFAEYLNRVVNMGQKKGEVAKDLAQRIKGRFSTEKDEPSDRGEEKIKFLDSGEVKVNLNNKKLEKKILETLTDGTIPAMYADMNGYIYLDDEEVGKVVLTEGKGEINEEKMRKIMEKCFKEAVGKLK